MTERERVASELRKKMNWYFVRAKMNDAASKAVYVAAVMGSAPYIMGFYETGNFRAFMVPGMMFLLAKMSKWAADEANENLEDKCDDMNRRMQKLLMHQKTR